MTYRSRTKQVEVENTVRRFRPVGNYKELVQIVVSRRVGFNVTKHPSEVRNGGSRRKDNSHVEEISTIPDTFHGEEGVSRFLVKLEDASNAGVEEAFGVDEASFSAFSRDDVGYSLPMGVSSITTA